MQFGDGCSVKEFFLPLAEPLGAIWLLMLVSLGWLLWQRQWRSAVWLAGPVLLIFVLASTPLVECLVASAERPYINASIAQYPGARDGAVDSRPSGFNLHYDAVIVLGGGYYASEHDAYGFALQGAASRLVTGLELFSSGRARHLVLGGSVSFARDTTRALSDCVLQWMGSLQSPPAEASVSLSDPP
jgi:hypothetical protein